uniref:Uncharacterized protein n=1 Tax=Macaca fascicularis TaxID=9541 RepID=A0A7N9CWV1_MACFA
MRGLAPGPAAAEGMPGPLELPARPRPVLAMPQLLPPVRQGSGPAARHAQTPTPVGSCTAEASPTGAAPCSAATGPIDHSRAEKCRRLTRNCRAAPPVAPMPHPLGEASWAPETGGDLENFFV